MEELDPSFASYPNLLALLDSFSSPLDLATDDMVPSHFSDSDIAEHGEAEETEREKRDREDATEPIPNKLRFNVVFHFVISHSVCC